MCKRLLSKRTQPLSGLSVSGEPNVGHSIIANLYNLGGTTSLANSDNLTYSKALEELTPRNWLVRRFKTAVLKHHSRARCRRIARIPSEYHYMCIGEKHLNFRIIPSAEATLFTSLVGVLSDEQIKDGVERMLKLAK